jgi:SAM-dependent methyltransferase
MAAALRCLESIENSPIFGDVVARAASYSPERVASTALALLDVRPEHAVLELGCGSGRLLSRLAPRAQRGAVFGVDPSPLMVRHARFRNRRWIERGVLDVWVGASRDLSWLADGALDRVIGLHVVYFWDDPRRDLAEIRRVLRPGGRLVLGFCPADTGAGPGDRARLAPSLLEEWLAQAGFRAIEAHADADAPQPLAWRACTC